MYCFTFKISWQIGKTWLLKCKLTYLRTDVTVIKLIFLLIVTCYKTFFRVVYDMNYQTLLKCVWWHRYPVFENHFPTFCLILKYALLWPILMAAILHCTLVSAQPQLLGSFLKKSGVNIFFFYKIESVSVNLIISKHLNCFWTYLNVFLGGVFR